LPLITPSKSQLVQLADLHKTSFQDGDFYIDFFFKNKLNLADCFVNFELDGTLSGVLYARPLKFKILKRVVVIPFITGVATNPNFRNRGIASSLLNEACDYYAKNKYPCVMLYPFNHDFYRRQKFQTVNYFYKPFLESYNRDEAPNYDYLLGKLIKILPTNFSAEKLKIEDFASCKKIYDCASKNESFFQIRTPSYFRMLLEEYLQDAGSGILFKHFGKPYGYLLFSQEGIKEMVFSHKSADKFLPIFSEILPSLECPINFRDSSTRDNLKPDCPFVLSSDIEYCMARICHIKKAIKIAIYDKKSPKKVCIILEDYMFKIWIKNGRAQFVKIFQKKKYHSELKKLNDKDFHIISTSKESLTTALLGNVKFNPLYKNIFYVYNILMYEKY